jgi:hypothetical protein
MVQSSGNMPRKVYGLSALRSSYFGPARAFVRTNDLIVDRHRKFCRHRADQIGLGIGSCLTETRPSIPGSMRLSLWAPAHMILPVPILLLKSMIALLFGKHRP